MIESLGRNDEHGGVYCNLCDWSKQCAPNMEQIEAAIADHLMKSHGKQLLVRVDDKTKEVIAIPSEARRPA